MTDLRKLDAAATQGVWEYIPCSAPGDVYGPSYIMKVSDEYCASDERFDGGTLTSDDAALAAALVNAYRAGELVELPTPKESE